MLVVKALKPWFRVESTLAGAPAPYSIRSFPLASATVCHRMFSGESAPPRLRGMTWSATYPGHAPVVLPVAGQGCWRWKLRRAAGSRLILPLASRSQAAQRGDVPIPGHADRSRVNWTGQLTY